MPRHGPRGRFVHLLVLDDEGQPKPSFRCGDSVEAATLATRWPDRITCKRCQAKYAYDMRGRR